MTMLAMASGGSIRWPLAFGVAVAAHLAIAGMVALSPEAPPPPAPPLAILMDLAPPALPPPPPPAPAPRPVAEAPVPKPWPVIERAEVKLRPPPPRPLPAVETPAPSPQITETVAKAEPPPDNAPVAAASGPPPADAMAAFQGQLMAHLARHKRYPMAARQRRQQGTAWVRLKIDRQGRVLSSSLERGCGIDALDREAEALVTRAQPLPAIPDDLNRADMELVLPVEFTLR